jgi:hypothetical protein
MTHRNVFSRIKKCSEMQNHDRLRDHDITFRAICLNHSHLFKKDFKLCFYYLMAHLKELSSLTGSNLEQLTKWLVSFFSPCNTWTVISKNIEGNICCKHKSEFRSTVTREDNSGYEIRYVHYCKCNHHFLNTCF